MCKAVDEARSLRKGVRLAYRFLKRGFGDYHKRVQRDKSTYLPKDSGWVKWRFGYIIGPVITHCKTEEGYAVPDMDMA